MPIKSGALTEKDVKNEGRSDYMHENKGEVWDKMSRGELGNFHTNAPMERSSA